MGLYDTMQQGKLPLNTALGAGVGNGGSFAQKQPMNAWAQKQQMRANPVMQGRPAMGAGPRPVGNMQRPNNNMADPMAQMQRINANAGMNGSISQNQNARQQLRNQQAAATGGGIGGSYGQLVGANPLLAEHRNAGQAAGQDMSWMDKPGALQLPANYGRPDVVRPDVQSGLANLQTPYDEQMNPIPESIPEPTPQPVGIGPSMYPPGTIMDENGLEPRRGPR